MTALQGGLVAAHTDCRCYWDGLVSAPAAAVSFATMFLSHNILVGGVILVGCHGMKRVD